ncbi:MAG TPA: sigma 54-interacting transcriptional regulator [Limnobacter sp.]|uniref:sigma 54-interacting transcriptional regulator n=1 Tax=Limnobacter sp. TaxID=2003368 RepID=UPI002ED8406C
MTYLSDKDTGGVASRAQVLELIDPGTEGHLEFIRRAHQRSSAAGLDTSSKVEMAPPPGAALRELVEKNNRLRSCALPFMETLYEQVVNTHSMVLLTDASGTIIESLGDDDFLVKAQKVALSPGVTWSESSKGTNAIGTALIEELPTVVHGQDHFLDVNRFLTCSAAPIFDPTGLPIGVLDVTGDYRSYHRHTMGLVRMSAQMIENHLFNSSFQDAIILHFHQRGEFLGSVVEGAAAFSPAGKFLAANRAAMIQFGMSSNALKSHTFSSLFGMPLSSLIDHYRTANPIPLILCLHNGNQVTARASLGSVGRSRFFDAVGLAKQSSDSNGPSVATNHTQAKSSGHTQCSKKTHLSSLKYLNTGDPQIAKVIDKVGKVIDKDIPILILGETGTGKEILAQAIHNDSPRHDYPFVAVNCASIPETLIESELFGYEDGAFTGAKKKGSQGRILQANGGTLFLDEIGDMPISLQARLLRVLQERVVTPLGSQKSIPVNLQVICATHRNLRDLITTGDFREDLYYRLHGLVVKLPALRERKDLPRIIQRILENESSNPEIRVSDEVLSAFQTHSWPGNIRQLTNILRTASVMAEDREMIEWDHLPDDFLDEWETLRLDKAHAAAEHTNQPVSSAPVHASAMSNNIDSQHNEPDTSNVEHRRPAFQVRSNMGQAQAVRKFPFQVKVHTPAKAAAPAARAVASSPTAPTGGLDQTFSKFREGRFNGWFNQGRQDPGQAMDTRQPSAFSVNARMGYRDDFAEDPVQDSRYDNRVDSRNLHDARAQGYLGGKHTAMQARPSEHPMNLDDLESKAIQEALESCRGNVSAAARMLGISRNTIYRRLNTK